MVSDALRRVLQAAEGAGDLAGPGVQTVSAEHPVCGDVVEFDVRLECGVILDLAWRAEGCPATMAVVAAAAGALRETAVTDVEARLRQRVGDLGGLGRTETHALALCVRALGRLEAL